MVLSMSDTHMSNDLSSICYAILEELSKTPNYPIKKCQNCGMYFIPKAKTDEIYCDYPKEDSKPCRDLGAFQAYTERLKNNQAMGEYRRTYQQKFMQVRKDKSNTKLAKDFETWKKKAKEKINDMKKGKLTENQVYDWILNYKNLVIKIPPIILQLLGRRALIKSPWKKPLKEFSDSSFFLLFFFMF